MPAATKENPPVSAAVGMMVGADGLTAAGAGATPEMAPEAPQLAQAAEWGTDPEPPAEFCWLRTRHSAVECPHLP